MPQSTSTLPSASMTDGMVVLAPASIPSDAANASAASFKKLLAQLDYLSAADTREVRRAYQFADRAHLGQKRNNGEPYITHPIAVAVQCTAWKLDAQALMAALLHDSMEDCGVTKSDLVEQFGTPVADMVDGLTKLDKLKFTTREENQAESFRKMLLAMASDVRVILIKLADRIHNMRTMADMPRHKWHRIASETMDIYAPIAYRLGINESYRELQDLAFRFTHPWRYATLAKALERSRKRRREIIQRLEYELQAAFQKSGLQIHLQGSEKDLYSIYRKMENTNAGFTKVGDIYSFKIIVPHTIDCYTALGTLHQTLKPVPGRFKDHIAIPKINGYQSLHTALVGPSNISIECQIRTEEMDVVAENGVAAHWLYKARADEAAVNRLGVQWMQSLLDIQRETHDSTEFWDNVRGDLFPDAIYVYTPKGRILALPRGATTVDFAYAIHSDLGNIALAARINGNTVPLSQVLSTGDIVEIITSEDAHPHPSWLNFVRTGRARSKIRNYLKTRAQGESATLGEKLLRQALRSEGYADLPAATPEMSPVWERLLQFTGNRNKEELFADIGVGKRIAVILAKHITSQLLERGIKPNPLLLSRERFNAEQTLKQGVPIVDGSESSLVKFSACCRPIPGDSIVGYLGHGEGLSIHRIGCEVARKMQRKDSERFIAIEWAEEPARLFETGLTITVGDRRGALARITAALSKVGVDITQVDMGDSTNSSVANFRLLVAVQDTHHLDEALRVLRHAPSVVRVKRMAPASTDPD